MNVIWRKLWSDLWDHKIRTLLVVLSIAAGVFAVGVVFGMADQLITGMDAAHQKVAPSHLNIILNDRIDRETATRLKNIKGVQDLEVLNQVSVRYKLKPEDEWKPAVLVMRDDYQDMKYDLLELKQGVWPKRNKIGIERATGPYFGIEIGDEVIFELDKTDRALAVNGKIRHPFVSPPSFGGEARFFVDAQGLERFGIPDGEFSQLLVRVEPYSLALSQEVASEIKDRLAKEDVGVGNIIYQDPSEHWGRFFVEGFNFVLQILAIASLFMSAILVTNTLTALITQQLNQIGIIKAVGGVTRTIIQVYLSTVLVYGAMALLIALPLGAIVAFYLSKTLLNLFNIDYEVFQISPLAIGLQLFAAIVIPVMAALWPVLSGAAITVREAIASYGLGRGNFGASRFDQWIEGVGRRFLSSPYAVALGNMFRRKGRLALTQVVLIIAGTMFLLVLSLAKSTDLTVANDLNRRGYDVRIGFQDEQRRDRLVRMARSIAGVEQAEVWFTHPAAILKEGQRISEAGIAAQLNAIPVESEMYKPLITAGRWLQPGDGQVLVIYQEIAEDHHIQVGDTVTLDLGELGDDSWQVVGIFQTVFDGGGFNGDPIYAPLDVVFDVTKKHNRGTRLFVQTQDHDEAYTLAMSDRLQTLFEARQRDVNLFATGTTFEDRQFADNQYAININMLLSLALIVAVVGGIGLMGTLSISVVERTREIGVMRAVGAHSRTVMGMLVMEGTLQGLLSWLVAVPISFVIGRPVARQLGQTMLDIDLDYAYAFEGVLIWLGIVLVISILASILPARNATLISVQESLAYA